MISHWSIKDIEKEISGINRRNLDVILFRNAMRIFPGLGMVLNSLIARRRSVVSFGDEILLPLFRCCAINWLASRASISVKNDSIAIKNAINDAIKIYDRHIQNTSLANITAMLISGNYSVLSKDQEPYKNAAHSIECAGRAIRALGIDENDILPILNKDFLFISEGNVKGLRASDIWWGESPLWFRQGWQGLEQYAISKNEDWQVWTEWYRSRLLAKRVPRQQVESARIKLPQVLWEQGAVVVNAEIKELIELSKGINLMNKDLSQTNTANDRTPSNSSGAISSILAAASGRVKFRSNSFIINDDGDLTAPPQGASVIISSSSSRRQLLCKVEFGAVLRVSQGEWVIKGGVIADWGENYRPIFAEAEGRIGYEDLVDGFSYQEYASGKSGIKLRVVTDWTVIPKAAILRPALVFRDESGTLVLNKKGEQIRHFLTANSRIGVGPGETVMPGDVIAAAYVAQSSVKSVLESLPVQRPSSHKFDWKNNKIEATIVLDPPFDAELAEAILNEVKRKMSSLMNKMQGNFIDQDISEELLSLGDVLAVPVDRIAVGVLLMRSSTLSAYAKSYSDATSKADRSIRALLDDVASSVNSLLNCYPGVRIINASRVELEVQNGDALAVDDAIDQVINTASVGLVIGQSARKAIGAARGSTKRLSDKIERADEQVRAEYIVELGKLVAARLLDTTNLVSAIAQRAGSEISQLGGDTWVEIRRSLPKATARGIARGTEKGLEITLRNAPHAIGIYLAHAIAGPWGVVASLVPRLLPHSRKVKKIADETDETE